MRYRMEYTSGGGRQVDGGLWELRGTAKSVVFQCIEPPFFSSQMPLKAQLPRTNEGKHYLKDWEDGTYTVYPNRCGTPHYFFPSTDEIAT